jgi:tetratricopeptide (TPR) repeat protein
MVEAGTRLGRFQLISLLGRGGMGEVWRAHDPQLKREVALKVLRSDMAEDAEWQARFQREARALAALSHPHVAQIYELAEAVPSSPSQPPDQGGKPLRFLVMELVAGESLREKLQKGPLPLREAVAVALQVAQALAAAHERGLIHRDIKPANIMLTPQGQVKILDFGLARQIPEPRNWEEADTLWQSIPGLVVGTPSYMAPEQVMGQECTDRCDVWALACCLGEMLTGKRLFEAPSLPATLQLILTSNQTLPTMRPGVPRALHRLLSQCLEKEPQHRPTMAEVARQLEAIQQQLAPVGRKLRLWRKVAFAAGLVALALSAAFLKQRLFPAPPPPGKALAVGLGTKPEPGEAALAPEKAAHLRACLAQALSQRVGLQLVTGKGGQVWVSWGGREEAKQVWYGVTIFASNKKDTVLASFQKACSPSQWALEAQALATEVANWVEVEALGRQLSDADELHGFLVRRTSSPQAARAFARGLAGLETGNFKDARDAFAAAAQLDSSFWPAYWYLAQVAGATSRFQEGRNYLERAKALCADPESREAVLLEAMEALLSDDRLKMLQSLQAAQEAFPNSKELAYRLAWAFRSADQPEKAIPILERLVSTGFRPLWSRPWAQLAESYLLAGRLTQALDRAEECEKRFPQEAQCSWVKALAFRLSHRQAEASQALQEAVRKRQDYSQADPLGTRQLLLWWAQLAGSPEDSQRQWELLAKEARAVLAQEPENWEARRLLGEALRALGQGQKAKETLLPLLAEQRRNPYAAYVLIALARVDASLGHKGQAETYLRQAGELWRRGQSPGPGPLAYNLACAWAGLGDLNEARTWLVRAKELRAFNWLEAALDPELAPLRQAGRLPEAAPPPAPTPGSPSP